MANTEVIRFRCSLEVKEEFERKALKDNLSLSEWLIAAGNAYGSVATILDSNVATKSLVATKSIVSPVIQPDKLVTKDNVKAVVAALPKSESTPREPAKIPTSIEMSMSDMKRHKLERMMK